MLNCIGRTATLVALCLASTAAMAAQTLSAVGPGPVIPISTGNVLALTRTPSVLCRVSAGAVLTYSVEVTADNVYGAPAASAEWFPLDTTAVGLNAAANFRIVSAVTGVRFNVTNYTSGTLTCAVAQ